MTTASGDLETEDVPSGYAFTLWTAGEVRSCMARVGVRPAELSRRLGVSHQWVSTRLNGKVPMTTADLARIAAVLGLVSPLALFAGGSFPPGPGTSSLGVDGGSTTHRYVARKRHLVAVDALLDASPPASDAPAAAELEADAAGSCGQARPRSPFAPEGPPQLLTTAVPA